VLDQLLSSVAAGGPGGIGGLALETAGGEQRMLFRRRAGAQALRRNSTVRVGQRTISGSTVWRAITVLAISLGVVVAVSWLLLLSQDVSFSAEIFEVVSAFSTTGLSLGITGQLDTFGRLLIIATMFWGRLGAVTTMLALLKRGARQRLMKTR
jgi:Trk-type K+ transport system membrane component